MAFLAVVDARPRPKSYEIPCILPANKGIRVPETGSLPDSVLSQSIPMLSVAERAGEAGKLRDVQGFAGDGHGRRGATQLVGFADRALGSLRRRAAVGQRREPIGSCRIAGLGSLHAGWLGDAGGHRGARDRSRPSATRRKPTERPIVIAAAALCVVLVAAVARAGTPGLPL
jgi:hypothetical protein